MARAAASCIFGKIGVSSVPRLYLRHIASSMLSGACRTADTYAGSWISSSRLTGAGVGESNSTPGSRNRPRTWDRAIVSSRRSGRIACWRPKS